jgi:PAS domain S-box-containing protein
LLFCAGSVGSWVALSQWTTSEAQALATQRARALQSTLDRILDIRCRAIDFLAKDWTAPRAPEQAVWESEASRVGDAPGLQWAGLALVDHAGAIQLAWPAADVFDRPVPPAARRSAIAAATAGKPVVLESTDGGFDGLLVASLVKDAAGLPGVIIGLLSSTDLLREALAIQPDDYVRVRGDSGILYTAPKQGHRRTISTYLVELGQVTWKVDMLEGDASAAAALGGTPVLALMAGLLLSAYCGDLSLRRLGRGTKVASASAPAPGLTPLERLLLDLDTLMVFVTSDDGTIRTASRAAELWLGYSASGTDGRSALDLFDPQSVQGLMHPLAQPRRRERTPWAALTAVAAQGQRDVQSLTLQRQDGGKLPAKVAVSALADARGQRDGFVFVVSGVPVTAAGPSPLTALTSVIASTPAIELTPAIALTASAQIPPDGAELVHRRDPPPTPAATLQRELPPGSLRVLIADDNAMHQRLACQKLMELGHAVDVADNGEQAVDRAGGGLFDLVLMDCEMPVLDGFEATRRVRKIAGPAASLIVIGLDTRIDDAAEARGHAAGMDAMLAKPLQLASLTATIERLRATVPLRAAS